MSLNIDPGSRRYVYRRTLPHIQKEDRPVFVTFATSRRWKIPPFARQFVLDACTRQQDKLILLHCAVVMPDHVHLIFTLLADDHGPFSVADVMHAIKGYSAHRINQALGRSGPVWQTERFDHVIRCNESLAQKVDYICQNPVRAGLASSAETYDWMWKASVPII